MSQTRSNVRSPHRDGTAVARAALMTHGRAEVIGDAPDRLRAVATRCGVEIVAGDRPDIVVVLGGDGTMLQAFHEFLGRGVPVIGINFGRFGFLASIQPDALEDGLRRAFAGDYVVVELPTLDFWQDGPPTVAVNDVVAASAEVGRLVEIEWAIGGEPLGTVPCDGIIVATPSGSTAYNLSNDGPVLMWGIDALAVTFVAPHSFHARPLVAPRGRDVVITNRTDGIPLALIADGHRAGEIAPDREVTVRLGQARSLLATLPDATFLTRFHSAFA
jgi:NAD+ kinase